MPAKIFISYKRSVETDRNLAEKLHRGLVDQGYDVFIDTGMSVGTDWVDEIQRRIQWCDYLVVVLSEAGASSEMVQGEVRFAHRQGQGSGKPQILPVRVQFQEPLDYEMDAYSGRIQYVLWENIEDTPRVLDQLIGAISSGSGLSPEQSSDSDLNSSKSTHADHPRPTPSSDPRVLTPPGGTIRATDRFYIRRKSDERIDQLAPLTGETLVVKGARQMGKSSLLIRYLAACKQVGKQFVFIDFQSFSQSTLDDYPELLKACAESFLRQLRLDFAGSLEFHNQQQFTEFMEDQIWSKVSDPVSIAMDEVDRIFGQPYQADFFSMLRYWHNLRAHPFSPWEDIDLALSISTEPYLLIDEADRSPFNVTPPIELASFDRSHLDKINYQYGNILGQAQLAQLFDLLKGHPFLTRLAFYRLMGPVKIGFGDLLDQAANDDGPFGDHLRSKLFQMQKQDGLLRAMKQIIANSSVSWEDHFYRLRGAGLITRDGDRVVPTNLLYAQFFKQQ